MLGGGCSPETPAVSAGPGKPPERPTPVVVTRPEQRAVEDVFLEREATLYPISVARISTRQEGFVRQRWVEEGDVVHEGDPLAELDATDRRLRLAELKASLQRAHATRVEAEGTWKRVEKLFAQHVISEGELEDKLAALDRARAAVEEVRARVEQAEQALEELRIVAPMDAVVSGRFIEEGSTWSAGMRWSSSNASTRSSRSVPSANVICTTYERAPPRWFTSPLSQVDPSRL